MRVGVVAVCIGLPANSFFCGGSPDLVRRFELLLGLGQQQSGNNILEFRIGLGGSVLFNHYNYRLRISRAGCYLINNVSQFSIILDALGRLYFAIGKCRRSKLRYYFGNRC